MDTKEIDLLKEEDVLNLYSGIIETGEIVAGHYVYVQCKRGTYVVQTYYWYSGYWGCENDTVTRGRSQCSSIRAQSAYLSCRDQGYGGAGYAYVNC